MENLSIKTLLHFHLGGSFKTDQLLKSHAYDV